MHQLLCNGSSEASRLYKNLPDVGLDWTRLRVSTLDIHFRDPEFLSVLKTGSNVVLASDFLQVFNDTIEKLNLLLKETVGVRKRTKKWFAVLVSCEGDDGDDVFQRSLYFFLMALNVCPDIAQNLQGILKFPKRFNLSNIFNDFTYICFDDMVHTSLIIESCFEVVSNMPRIVVTPYVSDIARDALQNIGVKVVFSKVVHQFAKLDPGRTKTVDFKYDAYPLYFNHRHFQPLEGFPEVYSAIVTDDVAFDPPYSTQEYSFYEYIANDIVKRFVN